MARLKWDNEDSPMYQTGVSKGVFYGDDGVGHAWSGLISVTEKPQTNAPTAIYNAMGSKYDTFGNVAEKKHGLSCYTYPEIMDNYLGYEYLEDFGFTVDERPPKKFHMAYRVELGNGLYEIHVLLNQIATFGETARQTKSNNAAPSTITMNLEGAVDPRLGTSHIRLDSRLPITKSAEILLFGDQYTDANIDSFLTAEPVWETVATNYAPIIEPDYDNMVWFGGDDYKPGVKKSEAWSGTDKLTFFYDELNNGLGVYSKTPLSDLDIYKDLYTDDDTPYIGIPILPKQQLSGSNVTISATVYMPNPIYPRASNQYAVLGLGTLGPKTGSPPNTRGSKEIQTSTSSFTTSGDGYDSILVYHGGLVDSGMVSFSRIFVRTSDDTSYFDINTVPKSRGDRYQRVETPGGDYTIHQQLRLRSTAKVKLSDITQYDFWLEAADSMLLSQNETFTFNGPQAVIDGDMFTIDDSIQGYAEG